MSFFLFVLFWLPRVVLYNMYISKDYSRFSVFCLVRVKSCVVVFVLMFSK